MPVMAKYSMGSHLLYMNFFGGPSIGLNVRAYQTRQFQDPIADADEGFRRGAIEGRNLLELGAVFGTGIDFQRPDNRILSFSIRNHIGLTPLGIINGRNAYNNYFAITVGYLY
ncbi:hypothetical protein RCC89_20365 [Cytophagaceae bacterium ABcell3]|nr:hypothetical protein RCC89_20365 [Cytophagaceae bacterium ABcell3]